MNGLTGPLNVLARIAQTRPPQPAGERCEMCGEAIADDHSHVVNTGTRALLCTCRPCYLLFTAQGAEMKFHAVPDRYLSFPDFSLGPGQWDHLDIPVSLAFFFHNSDLGRTVAFYPGPAGAAESELSLGAWDDVLAANPALAVLAPDVEALLVRGPGRSGGASSCLLVPIDRCYELVGRIRRVWRGFDGGSEARAEIDDFFAGVEARARPVAAASS